MSPSRNLSSIFVPTDLSAISPFVVQPREKEGDGEKCNESHLFAGVFIHFFYHPSVSILSIIILQ